MDIINVSSPNDGLGDKLRDAFIKVNANFSELLNTINNLDFSISAIDGLQDALNTIAASISGLQTQINTLDTRVDNHDADISTINSDVITINSSIATINDTIAQILNDLEPLLEFTAEDVANKATNFSVLNNIKYPSTLAVSNFVTALNSTINASIETLRNDAELLVNKATNFTVLNNTKYPTTSAVQAYVMNAISGLTGGSGSVIPNFSQVTTVGNTSSNGVIFTNPLAPANSTQLYGGGVQLSGTNRDLYLHILNGLEIHDFINGTVLLNTDGLSVADSTSGVQLDSAMLKFTSTTNKVTSVADKQFKYSNGTGSTTLEFLNPTSSTFALNIPAENGTLATKQWVTSFATQSKLEMLININQTGTSAPVVTVAHGTFSLGSISSARLGDGFYQIGFDSANVVLDASRCYFTCNTYNCTAFSEEMIEVKITDKSLKIFTSLNGFDGVDELLNNYKVHLTYFL